MMRLATIAAVLTILAICLPAQADVLTAVDWGGWYVTASTSRNFATGTEDSTVSYGGTAAVDYRRYLAFSESVALSPSTSYSGTSSKFYGGFNQIAYDDTSVAVFNQVLRNSSGTGPDSIQFRIAQLTASVGGTFAGVVVWKKEDFLNGANALANVYLTASTPLRVNVNINGTSPVRIVVKNGSTYYVSHTQSSGDGWLTIADPMTETWAVFNPFNVDNMFTDIGGTYTTRTFDNVQALGYYSTNTAASSALGNRVDDVEFQVSSPPEVPEPATMALLALGGLIALGGASRRRRVVS